MTKTTVPTLTEETRARLLEMEDERERRIDYLLELDDELLTRTITANLHFRDPMHDEFWALAVEPRLVRRVYEVLSEILRTNQYLLETRTGSEWDAWRPGAKRFQHHIAQRRGPVKTALKDLNRADTEEESVRYLTRMTTVLRAMTLAAREAGVLAEERATLRHPKTGLTLDEMFDQGLWDDKK